MVRIVTARFDDAALYRALEVRRQSQGTTWRAIARELGVSPSTFSRLARGRRPDVDTFARLVRWLDVPADQFIVDGDGATRTPHRDSLTLVSDVLGADTTLSADDAAAIEEIFRVAYTRFGRTAR